MKFNLFTSSAVGVLIGTAIGIAGYTFIYAKGASYLTNDPAACVNCHVMQEQYDGWIKSSHRSVAVCNDCHAPSALIPKYFTKAENGFWHSFAFTTGKFPDNIIARERNKKVTEKACFKCHKDIVEEIIATPHHGAGTGVSCVRCHREVGHPK